MLLESLFNDYFPDDRAVIFFCYDHFLRAYPAVAAAEDKRAALLEYSRPAAERAALLQALKQAAPERVLCWPFAPADEAAWQAEVDDLLTALAAILSREQPELPLNNELLTLALLWPVRHAECEEWLFGALGQHVDDPRERLAVLNLLPQFEATFFSTLHTVALPPLPLTARFNMESRMQAALAPCLKPEHLPVEMAQVAEQVAELWPSVTPRTVSGLRAALRFEPPPLPDETFRISERLFLGRHEAQQQFWQALWTVLQPPAEVQQIEMPYLFLLYGQGGMGKSWLMLRFEALADQLSDRFRHIKIDWQQEQHQRRFTRDNLTAEALLEMLYQTGLNHGAGAALQGYQQLKERRAAVQQKVARLLESLHQPEQAVATYAPLRQLSSAELTRLLRDQTKKPAVDPALARQFLQARLEPEELALYQHGPERLAAALGAGWRAMSHGQPLLLLFDTYELVDPLDGMVRLMVRHAGPQTVWVIAGRHNLVDSRTGTGYRDAFPHRARGIDLQQLVEGEVRAYLRDVAPHRPPDAETVSRMARMTAGIPLALSMAGQMWGDGLPLSEIVGEGHTPPEEIVSTMAERMLRHVDDPTAFYLFAMQPRPDPLVQQAVLLDLTPGPSPTSGEGSMPDLTPGPSPTQGEGSMSLPELLQDLSHRFASIREGSKGGRLHDKLGEFLHGYLLTHHTLRQTDPLLPQITERAVATLRAERAEIEFDLFTLHERVTDEEWQQRTLDLIEWLFWHDERAAWREFILRLVEGLGYDVEYAKAMLEIPARLAAGLRKRNRKQLPALSLEVNQREALLTMLERYATQGWLADDDPLATVERQAILLLKRGRWHTKQKQLETAHETLNRVEAMLPTEAEELRKALAWQHFRLGLQYRKLKRYEEAIEAYQRAIELEPEYVYPHNGLGIVYQDMKRYEEAIAAFQRAIELDPEVAYPHNNLGNVYRDMKRYEEAIEAYQRAIELDPELAVPHTGLGLVYRNMKRYEEAIEAYQRAIELDPELAVPHTGLGLVYRNMKRYEEAIEAYQRAIELDPEVAALHNYLGIVYQYDLKQLDQAIIPYQQAIEINSEWATPHDNLGDVYRKLKRYEEAIAAYQRAIEINPEWATPHNNLGNALADVGKNEEAVAAYLQGIERDGNFIEYSNLGNIYHRLGQHEQAIEAYQQAVQLNAQFAYPYLGLATIWRTLDNQDKAGQHLATARNLIAQQKHYSNYMGVCLLALEGKIDDALDSLTEALKESPEMCGWAKYDPILESLRGDARFVALVGSEE